MQHCIAEIPQQIHLRITERVSLPLRSLSDPAARTPTVRGDRCGLTASLYTLNRFSTIKGVLASNPDAQACYVKTLTERQHNRLNARHCSTIIASL